MAEWNEDVSSLLDSILNDNEPEEAVQESEPAPATPEPPQPEVDAVRYPDPLEARDAPALSQDITLADLLKEEGATEVTTVVNESDAAIDAAIDAVQAETEAVAETVFSQAVEDDEPFVFPEFTNEELMEQIDVRNFGTLVSLTNRRWHAKIKDRSAAKNAAIATQSDDASFEARKRLLVGADEKLKRVGKAIDEARTDHYAMTLPWSTIGVNDVGKRQGARLLPNSSFFDYVEKMSKHKANMNAALDEFVSAYPTLITIAQQKLGKAFNMADYPPPSAIRHHFDLSFDFDPIPSGEDFRGLQDAQVEKLAEALKKKVRHKLENAMQDMWHRVYNDVGHVAAVLSNPDALFQHTSFDKLKDHASMLKRLNVISDPFVEQVRQDIEAQLTKWDAKDVRKDDALRKRLGAAAVAIHNRMKEHANGSVH